MTPEQEKMIRDMARNKGTNEHSAAVAALLAERDAAKDLCKSYFNILEPLIGEDEIRHRLGVEVERHAGLLARVVAERDAALAKLGVVSELWSRFQRQERDGFALKFPAAMDAALADDPEIVAVVDGSIMTASGGSTRWHEFRAAVDLPHGDYRAIILRGDDK